MGLIIDPYKFVVAFNPDSISNLEHWYDANDSSTITKDGSNRVSQWNDKKGSNNLVQATGGNKPLWVSGSQNGKDVIRDDGARFMSVSITAITQPLTIYAVAKVAATQTASDIRELIRETTGSTVQLGLGPVSAGVNKLSTQFGGAHYYSASVTGLLDAWHLITWNALNTGTTPVYVDQVSAGGSQTTGTTSLDDFSISTSASGWSGDVGEILIYSKNVSGTENTNISNHLKEKWGLT